MVYFHLAENCERSLYPLFEACVVQWYDNASFRDKSFIDDSEFTAKMVWSAADSVRLWFFFILNEARTSTLFTVFQ